MKIQRLLKSFVFSLFAAIASLSFFALPVHAAAIAPVTVDNNQNLAGWHITSSPAGIDCTGGTGTCTYNFNQGDVVVLTATPPSGRSVYEWTGMNCQEGGGIGHLSNTCTITATCMCTNDVHIYFGWPTYTVQTAIEGTGKGTVYSSPSGLDCPSACSASFANSASITLTAVPAAGSVFAGWGTANDPGGATVCFTGGGLDGDMARGTSTTCTFPADGLNLASQSAMSGVAFFNSTAASTSTSTPTSTKAVTTTPKSSQPAAVPGQSVTAAPQAPTMDGIKVGGATGSSVKISADTATTVLPVNKPLVLSGKTIPNGIVTLTIHSTPRTATVTADANGNWTYTVTGLESGQHHVEAAVTDPTTKLTSAPVTIAAFTLGPSNARNVAATGHAATSKKAVSPLILVLPVLVVLALVAGFWWFKRRRASAPAKTM